MVEQADLERRIRAVVDAGGVFAEVEANELAGQAGLALELAEHFEGRTAEFEAFVADQEFGFDEWMWNLPNILAEAGLVDEAVAVADALAGLDADNDSQYAGNAATILARAGRRAEAKTRVESNLERWPEGPWVRIQAGEALAAADDLGAARSHFQQAVEIAEQGGDPSEVDTAYEYLIGFVAEQPGGAGDADAARRDRAAWQRRTGWISASVPPAPVAARPKVGRNQACPCGSGKKYKYCCGRPAP